MWRDANGPCEANNIEVSGSMVSWSWSCAGAKATIHWRGVVRYHSDTLDGELAVRTALTGQPPIEKTQPVTGRYLGPCDND
jgi:hypothetical protein